MLEIGANEKPNAWSGSPRHSEWMIPVCAWSDHRIDGDRPGITERSALVGWRDSVTLRNFGGDG
jgi:hypothetical protein